VPLALGQESVTIAVSAFSTANFPGIGTAGNTAVISLASVPANAAIIVGISAFVQQSSGPFGNSVNDGASYSSAVVKDFFTGSNQTWQSEWWFLLAASAGTHTITVTSGGSSSNVAGKVGAAYVTGLAGSSPVDQTNSNSNTGSSTPTTGSITPTVASSLVLAAMSDNSGSASDSFTHPPTTGTGTFTNAFVNVVGGSPNFWVGSCDYQILTSASAQNAAYGVTSGTNPWSAAIVDLKGATLIPASGGGLEGGMDAGMSGRMSIARDMREVRRWRDRQKVWNSLRAAA
jgi:hypothetical protein